MSIVNIAAYRFYPTEPEQLAGRRESLRSLCREQQLKGTILLSVEGLNMFLAGSREGVDAVLATVRSFPGFEDIPVKESLTEYQPFHRMLVKIKREIIPVGCADIRPVPDASPKLAPAELKAWLDEHRDVTLLDTRNDYETAMGTFCGAIDLKLKTFREFPEAAAKLPEEIKKKPVVMFCTGGIRCEEIGPYMCGLGFEQIYQLEGGILKYFEDCQQEHYDGDCFVFDQRVGVDPMLVPSDARECFACKHVLTLEDCADPKYREGISCPYCYLPPDIEYLQRKSARQASILAIASEQRGCTPYENRRWISIPQRLAGAPLLEALEAIYPGYSRAQWLTAIDLGEITAPAASKQEWKTVPVTPERVVREGERFLHTLQNYVEPKIDPNIELIHEDEALVVVNKGAPLPLHPSGRFQKNTLETILQSAYYPEKLRPAHRIDAWTTGIVVLTRKFLYASRLQPQFASGTVEKRYLAWVEGRPEWDTQTCRQAIASDPLPNGGRALDPKGLEAHTDFRVIDRRDDRTLVEAIPYTGRTHQIRLHLASLGFPIIGDPLYGSRGDSIAPDFSEDSQSEPMLLHAWQLSFDHPLTGERTTFQANPAW